MEVILATLLVLTVGAYYLALKARKAEDMVSYWGGGILFSLAGAYFAYYYTDLQIVSVIFTALALVGFFVGGLRLLLKVTANVR